MTRDANQIAQDHARKNVRGMDAATLDASRPTVGELTLLTSLGDAAEVISTVRDVTVQFTPAGLIVATHKDGAKVAFQPIPGWCILFEPNDAGE